MNYAFCLTVLILINAPTLINAPCLFSRNVILTHYLKTLIFRGNLIVAIFAVKKKIAKICLPILYIELNEGTDKNEEPSGVDKDVYCVCTYKI